MSPPVMRPEIVAFASRMEAVMRAHDESLGDSWKAAEKTELMRAMASAVGSMERANKARDIDKFVEQCIDVANVAMMLAWHHLRFGADQYPGLTAAQAKVFDVIRVHIAERGVAPTFREIAKAANLKSVAAIQDHIAALIRRKYIEATPKMPRSIRLKGTKPLRQPIKRG